MLNQRPREIQTWRSESSQNSGEGTQEPDPFSAQTARGALPLAVPLGKPQVQLLHPGNPLCLSHAAVTK